MSDEADRRFAAKVKAALDEDLSRLDRGTVMRLRVARRAALQKAPVRRNLALARYLPAGAAIAALVMALYLLWPQNPPAGAMVAAGLDDTETLLQSSDGLELYRDLEFYRWLAANEYRS